MAVNGTAPRCPHWLRVTPELLLRPGHTVRPMGHTHLNTRPRKPGSHLPQAETPPSMPMRTSSSVHDSENPNCAQLCGGREHALLQQPLARTHA